MNANESPAAEEQEPEPEAVIEIITEMSRWIHERRGWLMSPAHGSGSSEALTIYKASPTQN